MWRQENTESRERERLEGGSCKSWRAGTCHGKGGTRTRDGWAMYEAGDAGTRGTREGAHTGTEMDGHRGTVPKDMHKGYMRGTSEGHIP